MNYQKDIIKELEKILPTGNDQSRIFEDWLALSLACVEALPAHAKSAIIQKTMAEDTEETKKLFEDMRARYKPEYFVFFSKALAILITAADDTWEDIVGDVYMQWGGPNKYQAQYFTPWSLAQMTAQMTVDVGEVYTRLHAAYLETTSGKMHQFIAEGEGKPERVLAFVKENPESVIPLCQHIDPVTAQDCACGSGVMLLAAASCYPVWALNWGIVQFFGQDIDQTCVQMAKLNMMLHGLNGFTMKLEVAILEGQAAITEEKTL